MKDAFVRSSFAHLYICTFAKPYFTGFTVKENV